MSTFVDEATAAVLGIPELRARLRPDSPLGQRLMEAMPVYRRDQREAWQEEIDRLKAVEAWWRSDQERGEAARGDLAQLPALDRPLRRLRAESPLDDADLFELKRFLYFGLRVLDVSDELHADPDPSPQALVTRLRALMTTIHPEAEPSPRFHLAPSLDPLLAEARRVHRRAQKAERARRRDLEARITAQFGGRFDLRGRYHPDDDDASDALYAEPLLAHVDGQWRLVDEELGRHEDALAEASTAVDEAEARVRAELSAKIGGHVPTLDEAAQLLGRFDLRLARVRLRQEVGGCWPQWADEDEVVITGGREPRIAHALTADGDAVQPIDLRFDPRRPVVVTGPNMGGKSALLELVGVCLWCAQHALPAPASAMRFRPFEALIYVGSEEPRALAASEGLSSFGREVRRLVDAWEGSAPRLWLLDELGRGTHPDEGAEIACEVVSKRVDTGDAVIAATHFPALASLPGAERFHIAGLRDRQGLVDALDEVSSDLDAIRAALRAQMDYRPIRTSDSDVPRDARLVARALGLPIEPDRQPDEPS